MTDVHAASDPGSDDDTISLTSTQYASESESENPDHEYPVEDILAESIDADGDQIYLVKWTGYPLEMCTWEPRECIADDLLEQFWEAKRKRQDYKPFDFRLLAEAIKKKLERHFRRNKARQRRGLPLTEPTDPREAWGPVIPDLDHDSSPEAPPSDAAARAASNEVDVEMTDAGEGGLSKGGEQGADIFIADGEDTLNPSDDDVIVLDALSTSAEPKKQKQKKKKQKTKDTEMVAGAIHTKKSTKASKSLKPSTAGAGDTPKPTTEKNAAKAAKVAASNKPTMQRPAGFPELRPTATPVGPEPKSALPASENKKRTFSARKSGLSYGSKSAEANVFSGGKKRTRITKNQSSTKRQDFYFPNLHVRHMAEVRGRQKEDREIDPKQINKLFPIASGQPITPVAGDTGRRASATSLNQPEARPQGGPSGSPTPPPGVLVSTAHSDQAAPKKAKKKSVRFSGADESGPSHRAASATPATPSLENTPVLDGDTVFEEPEQLPTATQSITKTLALGEQGRPFKAMFSGVPSSDDPSPVLQSFLDEELLLFGYMCLAATFLKQFGGIRQRILFSGGIASVSAIGDEDTQAMLDAAAERLKLMASCLVFARSTHLVVLYPVRSDEWKEEPFGCPLPDDGRDRVLGYLTFSTPLDCTPFLQPLQDTAPLWEQGISSKIQDRARLMRAFFELDWGMYRALLPQNGRVGHVKRNFFLAFPPSAPCAIQQMAFWLRSVDPNCVLFLSNNRGAWMAFQEKVVAESEVGVVLVHEVATWTIRRFPGLTDLLLTDAKDCKIWSVSQSMLSPPLFPSPRIHADDASHRVNDTVHRPGHFRLVQLFPRGLAVLLTPSFIVTEPQRTVALLEWFYHQRLSSSEGVALVTTGKVCEYLRDVADEKARQRDEILGDRTFRSASDRNDAALKMGIDAVSCADYYKAMLLAAEICASPQTGDWCVVQADEAIDANDEQSLVNWFGWWTTVHMDRFRSFYVVGSKRAIKTKESGRGRCRIRLPRFALGMVANPDDVHHASEVNRRPQPVLAGADNQLVPSRAYPGVFTTEFSSYLRRFYRTDQPWKIYGYPVLWKDNDEAFRFGCMGSSYTTIPKWFAYTWPFQRGPRNHRAYIGLFYPIDEDVQSSLNWDRQPRHPWLVIYRPVNPHLTPYTETELIFWDPRAEKRLLGRPQLRQTDLTKAQQAVVEYVAANGTKKNKDMPLTTLYIGGNCGGATGPFNEFDITMQQLRALGQDYNNLLPPGITDRGYRRVLMADRGGAETDDRTTGDRSSKNPANGLGTGDSRSTPIDADTDAPGKIVFHPPRGDTGVVAGTEQALQAAVEKTRSRCNNNLFRCAQLVLEDKPHAETFMYEFHPTMDWYGKQVEEGRGFGHIHVNSWEAFFNAYRIEAGEAEDEADQAVPAEDSD